MLSKVLSQPDKHAPTSSIPGISQASVARDHPKLRIRAHHGTLNGDKGVFVDPLATIIAMVLPERLESCISGAPVREYLHSLDVVQPASDIAGGKAATVLPRGESIGEG